MSPFELNEQFENEIRSNEKKICDKKFKSYFQYQNPLSLVKELYKVKQAKNSSIRLLS